MDLAPYVARLEQECQTLRKVLPAAARATPTQYPAAWVYPLEEVGDAGLTHGQHLQRITQRIGVQIEVREPNDAAAGSTAVATLDRVVAEVRTALGGWTPDAAVYDTLDYLGGAIREFEAGKVVWQMRFETHFYDRRA